MRKYPWMVDVIKQRPMSILHPYVVEVYVARDGSEVCLSLTPPKAFCARDGAVSERDQAGAGVQPVRDVRGEDKRGVQTQGPAGIHHGGEGIRKGALAPLGMCVSCGFGSQEL
jgi:hypothetical protein